MNKSFLLVQTETFPFKKVIDSVIGLIFLVLLLAFVGLNAMEVFESSKFFKPLSTLLETYGPFLLLLLFGYNFLSQLIYKEVGTFVTDSEGFTLHKPNYSKKYLWDSIHTLSIRNSYSKFYSLELDEIKIELRLTKEELSELENILVSKDLMQDEPQKWYERIGRL